MNARRCVFSASAFILGLSLVALIGELCTRAISVLGYSTFVFREYDPILGTTLIPGSAGAHRWCWDGYVEINQHGMRDKERVLQGPSDVFRIGVFGDSIIEAVHVKPEETATYLLEERLNQELSPRRFEVLNFSVASYSTVQEYLRYQELGRQFDLDLVVVVSIPNDIVANIAPGDVMAGSFYSAPYLARSQGGFQLVPPMEPSRGERIASHAARTSSLALFMTKLYYRKVVPFATASRLEMPAWATHPIYSLYDTENPEAREAWDALQFILRAFRNSVTMNGDAFAVAFCAPEDSTWYPEGPRGDEIPAQVDTRMTQRQFSLFGQQTGTPVLDLGADIADYVRQQQLHPPYLSFECDGHFTAEGQAVIADSLFRFVKNLVPVQSWTSTITPRDSQRPGS